MRDLTKFLSNSKGIALLTVMVVLSIIMVIMAVLFNMVIKERIMTHNYVHQKQAYYIAEAAADQAVTIFVNFINNLHDEGSYVSKINGENKVNINNAGSYDSSFQSKLFAESDIIQEFINELGTSDIDVDYLSFEGTDANGYLYDYDDTSETAQDANTLTIKIEGSYKGEAALLHLRLRYCRHGAVYEYKGKGDW
jgi:Tfp pilus assembly protein PilX